MPTEALALVVRHSTPECDMGTRPKLEKARLRKLWSANRLARESGIAVSTIMGIEHGKSPRLGTIEKLSKALDMDPTEIDWPGNPLGLEDDDHAWRENRSQL